MAEQNGSERKVCSGLRPRPCVEQQRCRETDQAAPHAFDELARDIASGLSRRAALKRIGRGFAGAILASLGVEFAWMTPKAEAQSGADAGCAYNAFINWSSCQLIGISLSEDLLSGAAAAAGAEAGAAISLIFGPEAVPVGLVAGALIGEVAAFSAIEAYCAVKFQQDVDQCPHDPACTLGTDQNCSRCGDACTGGKVCLNSSCQCPSNQASCNGQCVSFNTNQNCNHCGDVCTGGRSCVNGQCQCPGGQAFCNSQCVPLGTNQNCNHCGDACVGRQTCVNKSCQCDSGWSKHGDMCCPPGNSVFCPEWDVNDCWPDGYQCCGAHSVPCTPTDVCCMDSPVGIPYCANPGGCCFGVSIDPNREKCCPAPSGKGGNRCPVQFTCCRDGSCVPSDGYCCDPPCPTGMICYAYGCHPG